MIMVAVHLGEELCLLIATCLFMFGVGTVLKFTSLDSFPEVGLLWHLASLASGIFLFNWIGATRQPVEV